VLITGCLSSANRIDYDTFIEAAERPPSARGTPPAKELAQAEAQLERETRLEPILRIALARNTDVVELKERVHAIVDRVPIAGRLPDLELKYEQWGVPIERPHALDDADTVMVGVRQTFPAPGSLDAQERAAAEDARVALQTLRARQLDLVAQATRAYLDYHLADREDRLHREHLDVTSRILELTRSSFGASGVAQQEVLRAELERRNVERELISIDRRRRSSAALLNALMGRLANAPLGATPDLEPKRIASGLAELERLADARRPELVAADHAVERSRALVDRASSEGRWPSFMLGADYMYMPMMPAPHGYGAMASITLPWINPRHAEEVTAAERARTADVRAKESVHVTVRFEVRDAHARHEAALASYRLIKTELLQATHRNYEAAQAAFATGRGSGAALLDALRSLLLVRLDELRATVELASSAADLERAVGTDLPEVAVVEGTQP
jgi:outer membrane protein TolC